jgi:hypothetical protein
MPSSARPADCRRVEALDLRAGRKVLDGRRQRHGQSGRCAAGATSFRRTMPSCWSAVAPGRRPKTDHRIQGGRCRGVCRSPTAVRRGHLDLQRDVHAHKDGPPPSSCVCKSGGKIGLANWTPEGFIGQIFKTLRKYIPPPVGINLPARARLTEMLVLAPSIKIEPRHSTSAMLGGALPGCVQDLLRPMIKAFAAPMRPTRRA